MLQAKKETTTFVYLFHLILKSCHNNISVVSKVRESRFFPVMDKGQMELEILLHGYGQSGLKGEITIDEPVTCNIKMNIIFPGILQSYA